MAEMLGLGLSHYPPLSMPGSRRCSTGARSWVP